MLDVNIALGITDKSTLKSQIHLMMLYELLNVFSKRIYLMCFEF